MNSQPHQSRAALESLVRKSFAELPPDAQDLVAIRIVGAPVFCWTNMPAAKLWDLYGACCGAALIWGQR